MLSSYRVALVEDGCEEAIEFFCEAEDVAHAREQADNAYPGCEFVEVQQLAVFG
jgi:hypothetical protein